MTKLNSRYQKSESYLEFAEQYIPLGSQTFSKSRTQYPFGVSPYFIEKGVGSKVWDIDGNEYIDFINGLASITLGYQDQNVDTAISKQLLNGITFSLSHPLEAEVAELIVNMVPCAEMVRFGKNGSDATAGAIRLARAYTGKEHVLVCGYHGWQDWYIGSTARDLGVPDSTKALTHTFEYNSIQSLIDCFEKYKGKIAAVIMEPMNVSFPEDGFLGKVKELAHKNGALLIFDETITGFRFSNGGAQEYFGVTPDLATFGKGLANGLPLSAIVGRKDIMQLMEDIFFSFTFGGETLSLAASKAVLQKLKSHNVCQALSQKGSVLVEKLSSLISQYELTKVLNVSGHPSWSFLNIKGTDSVSFDVIKTYFLQELFKKGILSFGTHNISYAHTKEDIDKLLNVYEEIFKDLQPALNQTDLEDKLECDVLKPLFSVRNKKNETNGKESS